MSDASAHPRSLSNLKNAKTIERTKEIPVEEKEENLIVYKPWGAEKN